MFSLPLLDRLSSLTMLALPTAYSAAWHRRATRPKALTETDVRERAPPADLACALDGRLLRDAVRTPCCSAAYCEECAQNALLERDFACPGCGARIASLDKLAPDTAVRARVHAHIEREIEASRKEAGEGGGAQGGQVCCGFLRGDGTCADLRAA
jgi:protein MPE1